MIFSFLKLSQPIGHIRALVVTCAISIPYLPKLFPWQLSKFCPLRKTIRWHWKLQKLQINSDFQRFLMGRNLWGLTNKLKLFFHFKSLQQFPGVGVAAYRRSRIPFLCESSRTLRWFLFQDTVAGLKSCKYSWLIQRLLHCFVTAFFYDDVQ